MNLLNLRSLTRDEVRSVDRIAIERYGMSGLVLMENAGRGAAEQIERYAPEGLVQIVCGTGNNGGDGFVIARHLQLDGRNVAITVIGSPDKLSADAKANMQILQQAKFPIAFVTDPTPKQLEQTFASSAVIVDALLGTGSSGPPRENIARVIRAANACPARKIAIDIPTGLDCDTGIAAEPCFIADLTITFVSRKVGFDHPHAQPYLGKVLVQGIGVPLALLQELALIVTN